MFLIKMQLFRHKKTSSGKGRGANQLPLTIKPYHQWQNRIFS